MALVGLSAAGPAMAVDPRAEAAAKDAIRKTASDYAESDFATAAARLDKAFRGCAGTRCSPGTKAFVLRDLGTMQFKMGDKDAAANSFAQALALDRDIDLSSKYDTPDVRAAWNRAKAAAAEAAVAKGGGPPPEQPIGGDFTHAPAAEQKVRTPLPIYVEPPEGTSLSRVVVKYKGARMSDWGKVELAKAGDGWGGLIPCGAVTQGPLVYWIQGFDSSGSPVASSGDPKHPFTVPIRAEISGEEPSLPGKPPPRACTPGSGGDTGEGGEGGGGEEGGAEGGPTAHRRYARLWVGISGTFELVSLPTVNDPCVLSQGGAVPAGYPANSSNLYCVDSNGNDYPPRNSTGVTINNNQIANPGSAGHANGGIQGGDARLMLSVDYALSQNLLVGGRMGYVLNSYPGSAASQDGRAAGFKIHIEGRATYQLGTAPLERVGFVPIGFAGLGFGEFDGHVTTVVSQPKVAGAQPVDVWLTDGPFFFVLGAGVRYQFSPRLAGTLAARLNIAIGGNGVLPTYGPEIGLAYGF